MGIYTASAIGKMMYHLVAIGIINLAEFYSRT